MTRRGKESERGFVLVTVLLTMALLALMAVGALSSGSLSYRMARNALAQSRGEALADAAINRAILGLLDSRLEKRWRVDGEPVHLSFGDADVTVRIQDELGTIDLNAADGPLLINLFESVGLSADQTEPLVDKILDWRDASQDRRPHGAKEAEYRAAGLDYVPRNGPFQSVDELKLVMGMTEVLYRSVAPALTVYSGRPAIDPRTAPKEALLALPSMDAGTVGALLANRTADVADSGDRSAVPPGALGEGITTAGRAFSITAEVTERGKLWRREEVVRLTGDSRRPFLVLSWK